MLDSDVRLICTLCILKDRKALTMLEANKGLNGALPATKLRIVVDSKEPGISKSKGVNRIGFDFTALGMKIEHVLRATPHRAAVHC